MEQIPDMFRRGKVAYEALINKLFTIYKILPLKARKELFNDKSKKNNDTLDATSYKNMCMDFNSLLQYALLDIGTTDKARYLEMLFVADVGDAAKSLGVVKEPRLDHFLASKLKKKDKRLKCTYFMLPDQTPEDILLFKSCIFDYVEPIKARIMKAFQIAQKLDRKMKIEEFLIHDFAELLEAFMSVENRIESEDPSIAVNKLKEMFFVHIDDYKNKVKSLIK